MSAIRIAACQVEIDTDAPFERRVRHATDLVRAQSACDLVVLPELWPTGGFLFERFAADAQPLDGPLVAELSAAAKAAGVWLHGGSFVERAADGRLFNTSVVFGPDGSLQAEYRKVHLFGFRDGETSVLAAGDDVVTVTTPFGVVGLSTCYDLRFPELYRRLVDAGAVLFVVPAAWPEVRISHWQLLAQARAVEDQVFVVATNTVGLQGKARLGGLSMVIDPWGDVLAEAGPDTEEVLHVDVDTDDVARVRERFPVLPDRRIT